MTLEEAHAEVLAKELAYGDACIDLAFDSRPQTREKGLVAIRELHAAVLAFGRAVLADFNMTMALGAASMGDREGAKRNMDALKARIDALACAKEPQEAAKEAS